MARWSVLPKRLWNDGFDWLSLEARTAVSGGCSRKLNADFEELSQAVWIDGKALLRGWDHGDEASPHGLDRWFRLVNPDAEATVSRASSRDRVDSFDWLIGLSRRLKWLVLENVS